MKIGLYKFVNVFFCENIKNSGAENEMFILEKDDTFVHVVIFLLVLQKKTIPHVLFFQIWRCVDVKSYHELQAIVTCRYAYGIQNIFIRKIVFFNLITSISVSKYIVIKLLK